MLLCSCIISCSQSPIRRCLEMRVMDSDEKFSLVSPQLVNKCDNSHCLYIYNTQSSIRKHHIRHFLTWAIRAIFFFLNQAPFEWVPGDLFHHPGLKQFIVLDYSKLLEEYGCFESSALQPGWIQEARLKWSQLKKNLSMKNCIPEVRKSHFCDL